MRQHNLRMSELVKKITFSITIYFMDHNSDWRADTYHSRPYENDVMRSAGTLFLLTCHPGGRPYKKLMGSRT
jgi:hypothetical protein